MPRQEYAGRAVGKFGEEEEVSVPRTGEVLLEKKSALVFIKEDDESSFGCATNLVELIVKSLEELIVKYENVPECKTLEE